MPRTRADAELLKACRDDLPELALSAIADGAAITGEAISAAITFQSPSALRTLLASGMDPSASYQPSELLPVMTPIVECLCQRANDEAWLSMFQALLDAGADVDEPWEQGGGITAREIARRDAPAAYALIEQKEMEDGIKKGKPGTGRGPL